MWAIFVRHAKLNNTNGGVLKPGLYRNRITYNRIKPFISETRIVTTPCKTENQPSTIYTYINLRRTFQPASSHIKMIDSLFKETFELRNINYLFRFYDRLILMFMDYRN